MQGQPREDMNIVIVGHVDHGKSTIIGRLLADTGSLPKGKLEQVRETCRRNSKPFEYAFLLDALKDEQAQGITIDAARCFFKTEKRHYILLDAPGHIEFLKNMVTGASRADAALLVIDAGEGIQENSRRHGTLLSMLGIRQIAVLVNKLDLVGYSRNAFEQICGEYDTFLARIGIQPYGFIPVSGFHGDNIASPSDAMPWYTGPTALQTLDAFKVGRPMEDKPFRMPVQAVYKFTQGGDSRRIVAGTIESGSVSVGDEVLFYPSGKKSRIASMEAFAADPGTRASAGQAIGFTLTEQIYVQRGELAAVPDQPQPNGCKRFRANIFWLSRQSMATGKEYLLKLGTAKVPVYLERVLRVMDASTLSTTEKEVIDRFDVAECILAAERPIALDQAEDLPGTGRFVLVDAYEIAGGGIVQEVMEDAQSWVRDKVLLRNVKWEKSMLSAEARAQKYSQRALLLMITGEKDAGKKPVAKALEKMLFDDGRLVYFIGMANLLYGVDADIKGQTDNRREEHFRRLAEISHLMLDAGCILIVTARCLTREDMTIVSAAIDPERIRVVWIGPEITTDISCDLRIPQFFSAQGAAEEVRAYLREQGMVFKPC